MDKIYNEIGLKSGDNVILHSSYKRIKNAFGVSIIDLITSLQNALTNKGSLIMPVFTYNFALSFGSGEAFDREKSPSKTGAVTEVFRKLPNVIRTSSPTHSFALWGNILNYFDYTNSPESPLGKGSVLEWMAKNNNTFVMLAGVNFNSFSFGHYLETAAPVPWADVSPWDHLYVKRAGYSINGMQKLKEIPGCSKQFVQFEKYLISNNFIKTFIYNNCIIYYIPVSILLEKGVDYFRNNYSNLLCKDVNCKPCNERKRKLNIY